ncbi:MAG: sigma-70 family RNA polymerase sigma factor, partial [bacterium]|nr:sigma-70 family RNA polymerase sigma factor [bacterium]
SKKFLHTLNLDDQLVTRDPMEQKDEELVTDIYRMAQQLKPKWRQVFFLFYDQRFSVKEIAGIMNLKEGNVKVILTHARNRVKETMGVKDEN